MNIICMKRIFGMLAPLLVLTACVELQTVGFLSRAIIDGERSTTVEDAPELDRRSCGSFVSDSTTVRLFAIGDWGSGSRLQVAVARAMATIARTERPHGIISTGDNFYPSGIKTADDQLIKSRWVSIYADSALQVPWFIALGNHDHRGNIAAQIDYSAKNPRWYLPAPYYAVQLAAGATTVALFVLDTDSLLEDTRNRSRQLHWLDSALATTDATVRIVVGHHPIRSYGVHGETHQLVRYLKPILDWRGVLLYLCGHDHDLQLIGHPDDRFVCIVSGGGGNARRTRYGAFTRFAWTGGGFVYLACRADSTVIAQFVGTSGIPLWCDTLRARGQSMGMIPTR
jgi:acid phosphatase